jgi:hypothetical protein
MEVKSLVDVVVRAARDYALGVDGFEHGAVNLALVALSDYGTEFLGVPEQGCEVSFVSKVGDSRHRPAGTVWDEHGGAVNCGAYTALQVGGAYYAISHGLGNCSDDMPTGIEIPGCSNRAGCVAVDIYRPVGSMTREKLLRIFVAISGASSEVDKACALSAVEAVTTYFRDFTVEPARQ